MSRNPLQDPVLELNKAWAPKKIITAMRAVVKMMTDKSYAVETKNMTFQKYSMQEWIEYSRECFEKEPEKHDWINCIGFQLMIPAVIVTSSEGTLRRNKAKLSRRNIYRRDKNTCQYCGKKMITEDVTLDHVTPKVRGGGFSWENIVCACQPCNARKADRTPAEAGMRLLSVPTTPKDTIAMELPREPKSLKTCWKHFIDIAYWDMELVEEVD